MKSTNIFFIDDYFSLACLSLFCFGLSKRFFWVQVTPLHSTSFSVHALLVKWLPFGSGFERDTKMAAAASLTQGRRHLLEDQKYPKYGNTFGQLVIEWFIHSVSLCWLITGGCSSTLKRNTLELLGMLLKRKREHKQHYDYCSNG